MRQHYGFTDEQFNLLAKLGIEQFDLFDAVKLFDPDNTGESLGVLNLLHYVDKKGDFNAPPTKTKHKLIAKALFNSLDLDAKGKLMILEYIEDRDNEFK